MKTLTTLIISLLFLVSFAQSNDTLELYKQAYRIVELYKNGNTKELLKIYKSSEGPRFKTEQQIKNDMERCNTRNINLMQMTINAVSIKRETGYIPQNKKEKRNKVINTEDFSFELNFLNTNSITIVFSKWWYENRTEPHKFNLEYIAFSCKTNS